MFMSTAVMRLTIAGRTFTARVSKPGAASGTGIGATGCPISNPSPCQYCVNFARNSGVQRPSAWDERQQPVHWPKAQAGRMKVRPGTMLRGEPAGDEAHDHSDEHQREHILRDLANGQAANVQHGKKRDQ